MKQIDINGITAELERKRIKNMYLRVLPPDGRVHISAPLRMNEEIIRRFVLSRREWILRQQAKISRLPLLRETEYVTGDEVFVWGRSFRLEVREGSFRSKASFERYSPSDPAKEKVILWIRPGSTMEARKRILHQWYRELLEAEIPRLIKKWEKVIGVRVGSFVIRDMKTRWGSCNIRTGRICLNLQLAGKPFECLEYVVVHELVHLLEKSHNSVFKGYMDRFLPNWRTLKRVLNGLS
ncbi:hypothetical protein HNQ56_003116 [Anaerotaenia torta]|uniref:M48 family metallopeptidase n=1 Tax=Anaerotaenia torta TaxID=433293 RepID=UPI003D1F4A64